MHLSNVICKQYVETSLNKETNACPTCILETEVVDGEAEIFVEDKFFSVRFEVNILLLPDDGHVEVPIPQYCAVHSDVLENLGKTN